MRMAIEITTDNAAFEPEPGPEVARILRGLAEQLENGGTAGSRELHDANGNTVGRWGVFER